MIKGLKGVENIYTQHSPLIREIIEDLSKGKAQRSSLSLFGNNSIREKATRNHMFHNRRHNI